MRFAQEVVRVDRVMADHPQQGSAVAFPVALPDTIGFPTVDAEMALDVFAHRAIDVGEDVRRRVVQRVVEVK